MGRSVAFLLVAACLLQPSLASAQGMSGDLIGTVKDAQGGVLPGATVRVSSPALIGGTVTSTTNEKGQLRFQALPPGVYTLDVELKGFAPYRVPDVSVGAGSTIDIPVVLTVAGSVSVVVEGTSSRIDARDPGYGTRFSKEDLQTIPTRRASMFDWIRSASGISPSSPTSGTSTTVSAFGSGTNENQFLFDGTNFTCPCNGVARSEPGVDFIQEIQVQSIGASAEFGNVQGAVINVVTRQGSERFLYDASYYSQMNGLTSQPAMLPLAAPLKGETGYERVKYRDFTTNLGGPALRERLWFFAGYQHLRDYDSQPGTDAAFPRTYDQDKVLAKLTWKFSPNWQLMQSFHDEFWVNAERPTAVLPYEATVQAERVRPGRYVRTSDPYRVTKYAVGCARGTIPLLPGEPAQHRNNDDGEPARHRDWHHERRPTAIRRTDASSHERQGHSQPLQAWALGSRSPVEVWRAGRTWRAPCTQRHSNRREI